MSDISSTLINKFGPAPALGLEVHSNLFNMINMIFKEHMFFSSIFHCFQGKIRLINLAYHY